MRPQGQNNNNNSGPRRSPRRHGPGGGQGGGGGERSGGYNNGGGRRQGGGNGSGSGVPLRNQVFDSNGPDVRVRGNAFQIYEKYQTLARDAASSGDRVAAENFLQHAEHYYRIIEVINENSAAEQRRYQPSQDASSNEAPQNNGDQSEQPNSDPAPEAQQAEAQVITPSRATPSTWEQTEESSSPSTLVNFETDASDPLAVASH